MDEIHNKIYKYFPDLLTPEKFAKFGLGAYGAAAPTPNPAFALIRLDVVLHFKGPANPVVTFVEWAAVSGLRVAMPEPDAIIGIVRHVTYALANCRHIDSITFPCMESAKLFKDLVKQWPLPLRHITIASDVDDSFDTFTAKVIEIRHPSPLREMTFSGCQVPEAKAGGVINLARGLSFTSLGLVRVRHFLSLLQQLNRVGTTTVMMNRRRAHGSAGATPTRRTGVSKGRRRGRAGAMIGTSEARARSTGPRKGTRAMATMRTRQRRRRGRGRLMATPTTVGEEEEDEATVT
jgi:hypothetical protein